MNSTNPSKSTSPSLSPSELLRLWADKQKDMLSLLLDAYCIVDADNKVVAFNIAFSEMCGLSFKKILKVADFAELIRVVPANRECPTLEIMREGKFTRIDELGATTEAYPSLKMIIAGMPIVSPDGKTLGAVVTIRNVSAENELQAKYYDRMRESIQDGLTGLFNKVYSEERLLRMIQLAYREEVPLSIVLCDIDFFKKVNDTKGHQAGDYVLSNVARLMKDQGRESDIVGRFGGEEFLAILWNTNTEGALVFAERVRTAVAEANIVFNGEKVGVTVSLGTSTFIDTWNIKTEAKRTMKELIASADEALYEAKRGGRNKTVQHTKSVPKKAA